MRRLVLPQSNGGANAYVARTHGPTVDTRAVDEYLAG
jgi:hypothetical protein